MPWGRENSFAFELRLRVVAKRFHQLVPPGFMSWRHVGGNHGRLQARAQPAAAPACPRPGSRSGFCFGLAGFGGVSILLVPERDVGRSFGMTKSHDP
jgi:hypothetical protein